MGILCMKIYNCVKIFLLAMLAVTLVFGLVLVGCGTTGGNRTPPTPDKQAEQLAADLNAIKAGSAMADGAMVSHRRGVSQNQPHRA
ncbi:hypothetical protein AGMMS49579_08790 [Spirochaetia bacterium]|nr:hypothetical protein AGMMS49579_08790 [Spirochaetia bacterium]